MKHFYKRYRQYVQYGCYLNERTVQIYAGMCKSSQYLKSVEEKRIFAMCKDKIKSNQLYLYGTFKKQPKCCTS